MIFRAEMFKVIGVALLFSKDHENWWNGFYVAVLKKSKKNYNFAMLNSLRFFALWAFKLLRCK